MKYIILIVFFGLITFKSYSQKNTEDTGSEINPQKLDKIHTLFELTNIKKESSETVELLIGYFQQLAPNLPEGYIEGMKSEFSSEDYLSRLAPLYDKAFSEGELQSLIDFFSSEIGKKWIGKLPEISNLSYQIMQEWQADMAMKLREKIEKDGYLNTIKKNSGEKNEK